MNIKVEDLASIKIKKLEKYVENTLAAVPQEHLRGLTKIVFVDSITEPRLNAAQRAQLPALYHPRMGGQTAWAEVALSVLIPRKKFHERLLSGLAIKPNIAQAVLSLIAQHYYLTLAKGIKKNQLEAACRIYAEKAFEKWREQQGGIRMKLTKPFRPFLDKMAKKLSKKYRAEMSSKSK